MTSETAAPSDRPTGRIPMIIGWACLGIACVLALVSFGAGPSDIDLLSARISPEKISDVTAAYTRQNAYRLAAGGFFGMFIAFWSVGYIIHAISFLPASGSRGAE